ncbi:MAG: TRAP transporter substrate-binding protein [Magnetococcales bacterium]|nr:TRAP transporter substrate-binding protein [Magnetococcales bacterium]
MKLSRNAFVLCLGVSLLAGFGSVRNASAEYVIKFSHVVSPQTPKGKAATAFADMVNERLAGKVKVIVFPNSQLYNDNKVMEAMRLSDSKTSGIMAAPSLSKFVKFSRTMQAFDLPFLFNDIKDVHKLADSDLVARMTQPMERKGIKALSFWDNGMKVFSIKGDKPLTQVPGDFKGNKFRIQSSDVHSAMIKALGGTPQKLSFKEVYTSLAQGVVDGQENAWSNVYSKKFYEVQDYITVSNHSYLGYLVVVSKTFWANLPEDIRSELTAIMKEATMANRKFAAEADSGDRAKIEQAGKAKIVELSEADRAQWIAATKKVEDQFRRQIGAGLLKAIHELLGH